MLNRIKPLISRLDPIKRIHVKTYISNAKNRLEQRTLATVQGELNSLYQGIRSVDSVVQNNASSTSTKRATRKRDQLLVQYWSTAAAAASVQNNDELFRVYEDSAFINHSDVSALPNPTNIVEQLGLAAYANR